MALLLKPAKNGTASKLVEEVVKRLWADLKGEGLWGTLKLVVSALFLLVMIVFLGFMAVGLAVAFLLPWVYYALQIVVFFVIFGPLILTWLYFTEKSDDDGLTKWRRRLNKRKNCEG